MILGHQLTPYTRINSKWIKDLNISLDTIKVLEETIGSKISGIPHSNIFTTISSRTREIKQRINKWDYIKLKSFCMTNETYFLLTVANIKINKSLVTTQIWSSLLIVYILLESSNKKVITASRNQWHDTFMSL